MCGSVCGGRTSRTSWWDDQRVESGLGQQCQERTKFGLAPDSDISLRGRCSSQCDKIFLFCTSEMEEKNGEIRELLNRESKTINSINSLRISREGGWLAGGGVGGVVAYPYFHGRKDGKPEVSPFNSQQPTNNPRNPPPTPRPGLFLIRTKCSKFYYNPGAMNFTFYYVRNLVPAGFLTVFNFVMTSLSLLPECFPLRKRELLLWWWITAGGSFFFFLITRNWDSKFC